ncbi:ecotin family protein [Vibrio campbellii]|uniref:Ecotin n=1 Tax=Vibrio campbellii TaxID=680 RepID=A0AAE9SNZ5_9VIBR|nr:ecotin family protein [Vibrio campbellii]UTZ23956.1 ecotin [Vibrio campbellii]UTZ28223.1 ecotin [Vibrio campbellii]UTZ33910.1 ecotin [Vibrio campbellii]
MKAVWLAAGALALSGCSAMNSANDVSRPSAEMFPEMENMTKHVFYVDPASNEAGKRVELVVGKMMETDCNRVSLGGSVSEHSLEGWGYTYYQVDASPAGGISTLMACPDDMEKVETFVQMPTRDLYRYNSKLPVVVYAPADLDVNIRVWAPEE